MKTEQFYRYRRFACLVFATVCMVIIPASAQEAGTRQDSPIPPRASARMELETRDPYFTVRLYIKNESSEQLELAYGSGHGGMSIVPTLYLNYRDARSSFPGWGVTVTPPVYRYPTNRAMNPDFVSVPPNQEILYGTFTMGYPPDRRTFNQVQKDKRIYTIQEASASITFYHPKLTLQTPRISVKGADKAKTP